MSTMVTTGYAGTSRELGTVGMTFAWSPSGSGMPTIAWSSPYLPPAGADTRRSLRRCDLRAPSQSANARSCEYGCTPHPIKPSKLSGWSSRPAVSYVSVMRRTIEVGIEVLVPRPSEEVWAYVSDLTHVSEWLAEFRSVAKQSDGPPGCGAVYSYVIDPGKRSGTFHIVEWQPGHRLAWDGPPLRWHLGAARPRGHFEVIDAGSGRAWFRSLYRPELTGSEAMLAPLIKRLLRRQRTADTERLRTLLEVPPA